MQFPNNECVSPARTKTIEIIISNILNQKNIHIINLLSQKNKKQYQFKNFISIKSKKRNRIKLINSMGIIIHLKRYKIQSKE